MQKKILLIDDEPDILDIYGTILRESGHEVDTACDGTGAKNKLDSLPFDLVISDVRMPNCTGIELIEWMKARNLATPIILMTGFMGAADAKVAADLGCKVFLPKPAKREDLFEAIKRSLEKQPGQAESAVVASSSEFARVPIEDFLSGKKIAYSVYVQLKDGKFIKIAHTGEDLDMPRISALKEKGIHELWLERGDFAKYIDLTRKVMKLVAPNAKISSETKVQLIRQVCSVAQENLRISGISEDNLKAAEEIFAASLDSLTSGPATIKLLESIMSGDQSEYSHGAMIGMFCGLMAKIMDWNSKKNIMMLTMAGFLHDVGLKELPKELRQKNPRTMTPEELAEYQKHPLIGAQLLSESGGVPDEVIRCVLQHHEDVRGIGYPKKLTRTEITPLSRIVFLVDTYCEEVTRLDPKLRSRSTEILNFLLDKNRGAFDANSVLALSLALKEPVLEKAQKNYVKRQSQRLVG